MKILFLGDIVGRPGREALKKVIPLWRDEFEPDLIIANGENMAHGAGITRNSLEEVLGAGIDLVTSGDHTWKHKEIAGLLEDKKIPLIRPANFPPGLPGKGYRLIEIRTKKVLVINLIGRVFMRQQYDDPFRKADKILKAMSEEADIIIVDWHAEATAEKVCLGWYLDGRVTAVLGTHTHVPTADERVLPNGTAYISDVGMVGVRDSSLGRRKEDAIKRYLTQGNIRLEVAEGPVEVDAVLIGTGKNGKANKIERIQKIVDL
ncbi:TIGR00282 family metallophosphoesterase [Patescibacteria group bacterium]|nr:TIGR00282 family metallophosphoesterase [Patescibacteria group bacterium]MBU2579695.1 TIGR00282 family metallophosphoesterase [Patescibacteria group bacterium]